MTRTGGESGAAGRRLDALTGIRGLAAWMVVFYHIRLSLVEIVPQGAIAAVSKGYLAVDLFFVLSGFVIWLTYGERLSTGDRGERLSFMWRRFARIWPLHIFILTILVAYAALVVLAGHDTADYPVAELPLHILLVQNWGFTSELAWNDPAWSISTEFAAYLAFPLIAVAARWDRLPSATLVAIAGVLAVLIAGLFAAHGQYELGGDITRLGLWRCLVEFSMGNIACILWRRWHHLPRASLWAGVAAVVVLAAAFSTRMPETVLVPLLFFLAILALALGQGVVSRFLAWKPVVYLGDISYSTYLSHFALFIFFKQLFVDESLQLGWIALTGFLMLLFFVSVALYHGVERPAQRRLNRLRPKPGRPVLAD